MLGHIKTGREILREQMEPLAKDLVKILTRNVIIGDDTSPKDIAKMAIDIADALITELNKDATYYEG